MCFFLGNGFYFYVDSFVLREGLDFSCKQVLFVLVALLYILGGLYFLMQAILFYVFLFFIFLLLREPWALLPLPPPFAGGWLQRVPFLSWGVFFVRAVF